MIKTKNNEKKWTQLKIPTIMYNDLSTIKEVLKEQYPTKNWKWEDVFRFLIYLARVATKLEVSPRFSQETAEPFKFSRINRTIEDAKKLSKEFPTVFEGILIGLLEKSIEKKRKADIKTIIEYAYLIIDQFNPKSKELDKNVEELLCKLVENGFIDYAIAFSEKYFEKITRSIALSVALKALEKKEFDRARNIFAAALKRLDNFSDITKNTLHEKYEKVIFKFYENAMRGVKCREKGKAKHPKDVLKDLFDAIKGLKNKLFLLEISSKYWRENYNFIDNVFNELYNDLWKDYTEVYSRMEIIKSMIRAGLADNAISKWSDLKEKQFESSSLYQYRDELIYVLTDNGYFEHVNKLLENDESLNSFYYSRVATYYLLEGNVDAAWDYLCKAIKMMAIFISNNLKYTQYTLFIKKWVIESLNDLLLKIENKKLEEIISETKVMIKVASIKYRPADGTCNGMRISIESSNNDWPVMPIVLDFSKMDSIGITRIEKNKEKELLGEILYRLLQLPNVELSWELPIIAYLPYAGYSNKAVEIWKSHFSKRQKFDFQDVMVLKALSCALIETNSEQQLLDILDFTIKKLTPYEKQMIWKSKDGLNISANFIAYMTALIEKETLINGPKAALSLLKERRLKRFLNKLEEQQLREALGYFRDELETGIIKTLIRAEKIDDAIDLMEKLKISDPKIGNMLVKKLFEQNQTEMASILINKLGLDVSDDALESVLTYRLKQNDFERFYLMWKSINRNKKEKLRGNIGREVGRYTVRKYFK